MKVVLQLVKEASVRVKGELISEIGKGYLLLCGFEEGDGAEVLSGMAKKIAKLRLFPDMNGKTNLSLSEVNGSILAVSQFTLLADCAHGNRPSFVKAMGREKAEMAYESFLGELTRLGMAVKSGSYGDEMAVSLVNDGPFTLYLDSRELVK